MLGVLMGDLPFGSSQVLKPETDVPFVASQYDQIYNQLRAVSDLTDDQPFITIFKHSPTDTALVEKVLKKQNHSYIQTFVWVQTNTRSGQGVQRFTNAIQFMTVGLKHSTKLDWSGFAADAAGRENVILGPGVTKKIVAAGNRALNPYQSPMYLFKTILEGFKLPPDTVVVNICAGVGSDALGLLPLRIKRVVAIEIDPEQTEAMAARARAMQAQLQEEEAKVTIEELTAADGEGFLGSKAWYDHKRAEESDSSDSSSDDDDNDSIDSVAPDECTVCPEKITAADTVVVCDACDGRLHDFCSKEGGPKGMRTHKCHEGGCATQPAKPKKSSAKKKADAK